MCNFLPFLTFLVIVSCGKVNDYGNNSSLKENRSDNYFSGTKLLSEGNNELGFQFLEAATDLTDVNANISVVAGDFRIDPVQQLEQENDFESLSTFVNSKAMPYLSSKLSVNDFETLLYLKGRSINYVNLKLKPKHVFFVSFPASSKNIEQLSIALHLKRTFWFTDKLAQRWSYKIRLVGEDGEYFDIMPVYSGANSLLANQDAVDALTEDKRMYSQVQAFGRNSSGTAFVFSSLDGPKSYEKIINDAL